jgi:hypothetical protein
VSAILHPADLTRGRGHDDRGGRTDRDAQGSGGARRRQSHRRLVPRVARFPALSIIPYTETGDRLSAAWLRAGLRWLGLRKRQAGGIFCNGLWCGQSPTAIRAMIAAGYPAERVFYYRGGMQSWRVLGLTVTGERQLERITCKRIISNWFPDGSICRLKTTAQIVCRHLDHGGSGSGQTVRRAICHVFQPA